jgi:O-antigen ligase
MIPELPLPRSRVPHEDQAVPEAFEKAPAQVDRFSRMLTTLLRWTLVVGVAIVPVAIGPRFTAKRDAVWAFCIVMVSLWVLRSLVSPRYSRRVSLGLWLPILVLGAALTASTMAAISTSIALWGSSYRQEGLLIWLCYLIAGMVTLCEFRGEPAWQSKWVAAVLVGAVLNAGYALIQYTDHDLLWKARFLLRPSGFQYNATFLAGLLVMAAPVSLALVVEACTVARRSWAVLLGLTLYLGLLVTGARGGWLAFWLAGGLWIWSTWSKLEPAARRWLAASTAALLMLTVVFLAPRGPFSRSFDAATLERVVAAGGLRATTADETPPDARTAAGRIGMTFTVKGGVPVRWTLWRAAVRNWLRRPWLGQGLDSFRHIPNPRDSLEARIYAGRDLANVFYDRTHNQFLEMAVTAGTLGLLAFLWAVLGFVFPAAAAARKGDAVLGAVVAGALAHLMMLQIQPSFIGTSFIFWSFLGFGAARAYRSAR